MGGGPVAGVGHEVTGDREPRAALPLLNQSNARIQVASENRTKCKNVGEFCR